MKSVDVADLPEHLGECLEAVQNGESITIVAGTRRLARLVPAEETEETEEEYFERLVREGKIERGTGKMPDDFLTRPLPKFEESVLEQFLEDRRTGLLVPPKDPDKMREAIEWLLDHHDQWPAMGARARRVVEERYSLDVVAERYFRLFQDLQRN